MVIHYDYKNIETDNLLMSLYMGANLQAMHEIYGDYGLNIDKELDKLFKYIMESNKLDRMMINKLFKEFNIKGWRLNLLEFATNWKEVSFGKSFDEFIYYIESIDEDKVLNIIYNKLLRLKKDKKEIDFLKEKSKVQINDILEALMDFEIDAELKWYLVEVCYDVKGFFNKCSEFLKDSRKILGKKLGPFNERGYRWGEKLSEKIEEEGIGFIKRVIEDFDEDQFDNIMICPRIMDEYAFDIFDGLNPKEIYMYFGESYESLDKIFGKENERQWVQNVLKYLSDGSRFRIMELLKEKPKYSSELAESLAISNATISHHTTLLFLAKLLEETRINNKNCMRIREASIDKFVEVFNKEFNLEEGERV